MRPKKKPAAKAPAPALVLTPEQRWAQLVEHTQLGHLEELFRRVQQIGANERLEPRPPSEYRLQLRRLEGRAVRNFNFDEFAAWVAERQKIAEEAAAERRAANEEKERVAEIRRARRGALRGCISDYRRQVKDENNYYIGKEGVLQALLDGLGGWNEQVKLKGVDIDFGEVEDAWEPRIFYEIISGFIDATTIGELKLMAEQIELLEPLEQTPDARGNIFLRHNETVLRKLRAAKHCLLEAMLFATGETVRPRARVVALRARANSTRCDPP
mgnify:CR=1 FL=1